MNNIGIMQSRLTKPYNRGIQFFPHDEKWQNEFFLSEQIGLDYIEWIVADGDNPFFGGFERIENLKLVIQKSAIGIRAICLDYLMDLNWNDKYNYIATSVNWISFIASRIDCQTIVIPIYEKNLNITSITDLIIDPLRRNATNTKIAFEFLDVDNLVGINFINDLNYPDKLCFREGSFGCCFDIGNNYKRDIIKEMEMYNNSNMLNHIHIKEKNILGESVSLGEGVFGRQYWKEIFKFLKTINYRGDFTLQVARGKEGEEKEAVKKQLEFVKGLINETD